MSAKPPLSAATTNPLTWPVGWPRTDRPRRSAFKNQTVYRAYQAIHAELNRMGIPSRDVVVSTNARLKPDGTPYSGQRRITDPGASVWFVVDGAERVLACDRWDDLADNLHAIELHIGSIRGQERWGVGTAAQAFAGFVALPEQAGGEPWWEVLGLPRTASVEQIRAAYRRAALDCHPDRGGSESSWDRLQRAVKSATEGREAAGG